jgi:hypothetical protein
MGGGRGSIPEGRDVSDWRTLLVGGACLCGLILLAGLIVTWLVVRGSEPPEEG